MIFWTFDTFFPGKKYFRRFFRPINNFLRTNLKLTVWNFSNTEFFFSIFPQVEEGASESTQQYQVQIASLTSQVESLQNKTTEWKKKFETEVSARQQTQEALTSLQNVVRELSIDHEKDSAFASHRNLELQTMIGVHFWCFQTKKQKKKHFFSFIFVTALGYCRYGL